MPHKPAVVPELVRIDAEIHRMWALHRLWVQSKDDGKTNPVEALRAIDDLLDQRHKLVPSEVHNILERADATEWGPADTGQAA